MTTALPTASLVAVLERRSLLHDLTEGAAEHLAESPRTAYVGFDPSGPSLHLGHLLPVMGLLHAQRSGHTPIVLVGGGTGLIGDPSGKAAERQLLSKEDVARNAESIRTQLANFLDFGPGSNTARMRNNLDWLGGLPLVDFLRDIGKHFSVNQMLAKESVKRRVDGGEAGISFTEFSYSLLQSYDFLELHRSEGCTVQMGGSDQWGNITAGIELVRRAEGARAYGVVFPLITQASGVKFGKTEEGAVWLDAEQLSVYDFWQYWRNTEDADVGRFMRLFTELPLDEIKKLEALKNEEINEAKKILADEITKLCHGEAGAKIASATALETFEGTGLSANLPTLEVSKNDLEAGFTAFDLFRQAGLANSNGEARRLIKGNGARLNDIIITDETLLISSKDKNKENVIKLSAGKKRHILIRDVD